MAAETKRPRNVRKDRRSGPGRDEAFVEGADFPLSNDMLGAARERGGKKARAGWRLVDRFEKKLPGPWLLVWAESR
jgi:hypothetical protein